MFFKKTHISSVIKTAALGCFLILTNPLVSQVSLSGTSYTETFDAIGSGLPTGWTVRTGSSASALGTSATYTSTQTAWSSTAGQFSNAAAAEVPAASTDAAATQNTRTDRALAVRQSGSFGDPGTAFVLQLANTTGFSNFTLGFKLMQLDPTATTGRTVTWNVDYGFGASPASFTNSTTAPASITTTVGSSWGSTNVTVNFGSALDNNTGPVWIRIAAKTASSGAGSRPHSAIDDFNLTFNPSTSPAITLTPASLSAFTYVAGNGPSSEQTFSASGSNLTANISLSAPVNYEISLTSGSGFTNSLTLTQTSGSVSATTIYVRLKSGLSVATYGGEIVTASSSGAASKTITCSGTVTGSASSDIITAGGESATISSLTTTAPPLTSSTGLQVWQFKVRDGGASLNDSDNLSSILNSFIISEASGNAVDDWSTAIRTIELFDGSTNIATGVVSTGPNQVSFSGLSLSVADNTEKTYSLRLSLNCGFGSANADGDDFGFQISNGNVTFSASGSGKTTFAATASTNAQNVITVNATGLVFLQQPSTTGMNSIMSPAVTVIAGDACGNTDINFSGTISLTSTGSLVGTPVSATASSGVATFSTLTHSAAGTGLTLTAASGAFSVISNTFNIVTTTVLGGGDLAIVGICVNIDGCNGTSGGTDEISFVTFEDITPGTAIDITDNGFERVGCGSNNWGNGEGVIRLTRSTSTITKGTIITFRVVNNTYFSSVSPDANWTISYPVGSSFNLNSNDEQVYMMQGGTWNAGTSGSSNATYTGGTYMFAINTYTAWTCNDNVTTRGALPEALKCFSIMPSTGTVNVKYTGSVTPASQKDWIDRLNSISNWSASTTCTAYNALSPNYSGGYSFTITAGGFNSGYWTGATNTDWYDCNNWQNFKVPDSLANVTIDNVTNDPVIGASPSLFPNGAVCNDLLITSTSGSGILTMNNALSYFSVKGNIINNGIITASNGTTDFRASNTQNISGTGTTTFFNLRLNNTSTGGITLSKDVTASGTLAFINGMLHTGTSRFIISNPVAPAISGYTSTKFINGNLRHFIASNTSTYAFPIGNGATSADYKRIDFVNNNLTGVNYIDASVNTITEASPNDDGTFAGEGEMQGGSQLSYIMENAQWDLSPDAAPTGNSYGTRLYVANTGLSSSEDNNFFVVKRPSASATYADWESLESTTTVPNTGAAGRIYNSGLGYAERLGYTSFSKFAISTAIEPLPIELLSFDAVYNGSGIVNIAWTTATEINNDFFTVERSADGVQFSTLFDADGAGTSSIALNYAGRDVNPLKGINYYRLKQTDFDGRYSYSQIVAVNTGHSVHTRVYPNPAADNINFSIAGAEGRILSEIINIHGVVVSKMKHDPSDKSFFTLSISELPPGTYILKLITTQNTIQTIFIKQ